MYISYPNYVNYAAPQDEPTDYYTEQQDPASETPPPPLAAGTKELMDQGMEFFKEGRYIDAFSMFSRATLADLNAPLARFVYAHTLFALGLYDDAAGEIRFGLALMPEWPEVGGDLKQLYGEVKDFDAQMAALKAHLKVRGEDENALLVLAYTSYFTGDLYAAEKAFEQIADSSNPETASAAGLFQTVIQKIKAADH